MTSIVACDPDLRIVFCNDAFRRTHGYEPDELPGRPLPLLPVAGEEPAALWRRVTEQALREGLCEATVAVRHRNGDAVPRPVLVVPWRREGGDPAEPSAGFLVLAAVGPDSPPAVPTPAQRAIADTAVQALQTRIESLEAMNRAKDVFLGRVLHDVRTPLGGITGFAATLLMRLPGPLTADQERQIKTIEGCGQDLLAQLDRLPDALRIETGTVETQPGLVSCRVVLAEVARVWRPRAAAKGLGLDIVIPGEDEVLRSDPWIIEQIVVRLVENAVAFTERGGVVITCDRPAEGSGGVRIRIGDSGPGLSAKDQDKLFQPFTQLLAAPARGKRGSGLGLYQSRRLARLIGGRVSCESVPGQGSVFTLTVPEGAWDGAGPGD